MVFGILNPNSQKGERRSLSENFYKTQFTLDHRSKSDLTLSDLYTKVSGQLKKM